MLLEKVKKTVKKYALLQSGDRVLVAVSGGPDSVCLLDVLCALAKDFDLALHAAHLDHMFRGRESADEALFVAGLARKYRLPSTVGKIDVPALCRERGVSAQAGAREARYEFLARVAGETGASRIATGHTATDQAETFLMRLLRGAGLMGLSAIPPKRDRIIRPLIEITREEILEYARLGGLQYVSDPSNDKPVYTRNRIRMEVLPVLKRFNPKIVETLASETNMLRDEDEAAETCLASQGGGPTVQDGDRVEIPREFFNSLHPAFRRRVLRKTIDLAGVDISRISLVQIDEAVSFMAGAQTGRAIHLPGGLMIEREYDTFLVGPAATGEPFSYAVAVPGITVISDLGLEIETRVQEWRYEQDCSGGKGARDAAGEENYFWQALLDYAKIPPFLTIRNRRPGDRFRPAGMGGRSKKLQDFFVDEKVPRRSRDRRLLVASGDDILWVVGLRTDERFRPGPDTKNVLVVRVSGGSA